MEEKEELNRSELVSHIVLNHRKGKDDPTAPRFQSFMKAIHLPAELDISSHGPPIWDQGRIGSCTAHGTLRCVDFAAIQYAHQHGKENIFTTRPSRLFEYANSRILEGTSLSVDSGATVADAFKAISVFSVCDESLWPYETDKFTEKPPPSAYNSAHKFKHFSAMVVPQNEIAIKQALVNGFPVAFGMWCYDSFMSDKCMKTGVVPIPDTKKEKCQGGHCCAITGYNDAIQMFTFANSWGNKVGLPDKLGYFNIPYSFILNPSLAFDFHSCTLFY